MSVEKQTISIEGDTHGNKNLTNIIDVLTRVHDELSHIAPIIVKDATKYDLIARNMDEAIILLAFREKQAKRVGEYHKKINKLIQKI
jgi:hypothetical protein